MDVLFLVPPIDDSFLDMPQEFLGVCQLAAVLRKKGYSVEVFQPHIYNMNIQQIIDVVSKRNFKVLGITVMYNAIYSTIEIVKGLRLKGVKGLIVLGGYFPTLATREVLLECEGADCVMRGEGEDGFVELMQRLDKGEYWKDIDGIAYKDATGECIINPQRHLVKDINSLPFPARDNLKKILLQKGFTYVMTSRGCYGDCLFCNIAAFHKISKGQKWRHIEAVRVVDEIEYLVKEFDLKWITIHDDNFLHPGKNGKQRALEFADELNRRKIDIKFSISCRTQDVEQELFSRLKEVGLSQVFIGVESMNQSVLDYTKKATTTDDNKKALDILDNLKIPVCTYFIMFNPQSTMEEVKRDIYFLKERIERELGDSINYRFNFNAINLDIGTKLAQKLQNSLFVKKGRFIYTYTIADRKVEKLRRAMEYVMEICEAPCRYLYLLREGWNFNQTVTSLEHIQLNVALEIINLIENNITVTDEWLKSTFTDMLEKLEKITSVNSKLMECEEYYRYMPLYMFKEDDRYYLYDIYLSETVEVEGAIPMAVDMVLDGTLKYNEKEIRKILGGRINYEDIESTVVWFKKMRHSGYLKNYRKLEAKCVDRNKVMGKLREILCQ